VISCVAGGDRRRDSGWGGHQGNGDWDNVTTFDFLMEQGVGGSQPSKASLIRDKKIEIKRVCLLLALYCYASCCVCVLYVKLF
jgi:hypothetical protein